MPTTALVTDIGNDLLYGTTPDRLLEWVAQCLDRLAETGAATTLTQMPTASIEGLSERRFQFFRRLFFPRSALTLADAKRLVREINERLMNLGASRNIPIIPVSPSWYGFDPIHLQRYAKREAWPALLAGWRSANAPLVLKRPSLWTSAYLATLAPLERSQFGIERRTAQPCGRFFDGTTISLY